MIRVISIPKTGTPTPDGQVRSVLGPSEAGTRVEVALKDVDPGKTHRLARSEKTQVAYVLEGKDATFTHTAASGRPNTRRNGGRASTWNLVRKQPSPRQAPRSLSCW